ncbi:MAG: hypothetical protein IT531_06500 [Burkholderiales bacterium]|nr:hypothetical protein [Burkholderiales bacterium]
MQAAQRGRAALTICSTAFESLGRAQARALGFSELPILLVPHPFGIRTRAEVRAMAATLVEDIAALCTPRAQATGVESAQRGSVSSPGRAARIRVADEHEAVQRLFRERRWGDGLPVIAPTPERVERMLALCAASAQSVVATLAPGFGAATLEAIAINAVAAGCDPELLPLVVAAVKGAADPRFNLQAIQATTNPVAVWVLVNGPAAAALAINAGINCLGQGHWANATLGRAVHLLLQNVGGARPGEMDRATHGQPGKFTFCCAENEAQSPWDALRIERGFGPAVSTVTVIGAEGTMNMNSHCKDADQLLRAFAETMMHPPSNEYTHGGEPWLIIGPEHAEILQRAGLSKADVKRELWLRSRLPAQRMTDKDLIRVEDSRRDELGPIGPDTLLPIARRAEDIGIVVAGAAGTHSVYVPCFGNSRAVTVAVEPV